jgi:hypothetical protein
MTGLQEIQEALRSGDLRDTSPAAIESWNRGRLAEAMTATRPAPAPCPTWCTVHRSESGWDHLESATEADRTCSAVIGRVSNDRGEQIEVSIERFQSYSKRGAPVVDVPRVEISGRLEAMTEDVGRQVGLHLIAAAGKITPPPELARHTEAQLRMLAGSIEPNRR